MLYNNLKQTTQKTMAYGAESALRKVHFPALKGPDAPKGGKGCKPDKVNVQEYGKQWNRKCPKGQELGIKDYNTLNRWLRGEQGAKFKESQTKGAKRKRRALNRKKESKKTVVKTTAAFSMD